MVSCSFPEVVFRELRSSVSQVNQVNMVWSIAADSTVVQKKSDFKTSEIHPSSTSDLHLP